MRERERLQGRIRKVVLWRNTGGKGPPRWGMSVLFDAPGSGGGLSEWRREPISIAEIEERILPLLRREPLLLAPPDKPSA